MMRIYNGEHRYYCGVDLHTKRMYLCIIDHEGNTRLHRNVRAKPHDFVNAIEGFRDDLVVGAECMFTWYWLAGLCRDEKIKFLLGHALYMKAIHGGKKKDDKLDSEKNVRLMCGGTFPMRARRWSRSDELRSQNLLCRTGPPLAPAFTSIGVSR